jgi:glycosyltransferase involved in cell wall biosynthesis
MGVALRPAAPMFAPVQGQPLAIDDAPDVGVTNAASSPQRLKILHVLRAPVGGLFRHVLDLARGQADRGHQIGLIVDSSIGGAHAEGVLAQLAPSLTFGVERVAMARQPSARDFTALRAVARRIAELAPDVVHGHGAKGAALARLAPRSGNAIRVYTPHGGSLVYAPGSLTSGLYLTLERLLNWRTDLFLFESDYIAQQFRTRIGAPHGLVHVVRNGLRASDFSPIASHADATDVVFVGELRVLKGVDVLLRSLAAFKQSGRILTATIAGDGPDRDEFVALTRALGLDGQVRFVGYRAAREAFAMGRILIVPSRAESLPYIVLEAAAAQIPIIATRVGGISEIFGPEAAQLVAPDDVSALVGAIGAALADPGRVLKVTQALNARVGREFTVDAMVEQGLAAYREALTKQKRRQCT